MPRLPPVNEGSTTAALIVVGIMAVAECYKRGQEAGDERDAAIQYMQAVGHSIDRKCNAVYQHRSTNDRKKINPVRPT